MKTTSNWKRWAIILTIWTVIVFVAILFSVFLHEDGHGIGAKFDGIAVSTGFNKVGNPGRTPDDPDFRTGMKDGIWTGLLGPVTTWLLAIVFTLWLYRFKQPGWGALAVGAMAVANGLGRGVPMLMFVGNALLGHLYTVDEAYWGMWFVTHICRPELAAFDPAVLAQTQPAIFLSEPGVWAAPLLSLAISLVCLSLAYRRILKLWREPLGRCSAYGLMILLPVAAWFVATPLLDVLDRMIRINW